MPQKDDKKDKSKREEGSSQGGKDHKSSGYSRKPTSVSSLASVYNIATGRYTPSDAGSSETLMAVKCGQRVNEYGQDLYDTVLLCIVCAKHNKVALTTLGPKGQFLPSGAIKTGESWQMAAISLLQRALSMQKTSSNQVMFSHLEMIDILRVQMPVYFEFITRVTFLVKLKDDACKASECQDNDRIAWVSKDQLVQMVNSGEMMAGPEPSRLLQKRSGGINREVAILDVLLYQMGVDSKKSEYELLRSCGCTEADILKIYGDFVQHCFPSEFMTQHTLKTYLQALKLTISLEPSSLLRAFTLNRHPFINFHEFLLGLAILDKLTGCLAEQTSSSSVQDQSRLSSSVIKSDLLSKLKTEFIFRYYAKSSRDYIIEAELTHALRELKVANRDESKALKSMLKNGRISSETFLSAMENIIGQVQQVFPSATSTTGLVSPFTHVRTHQVYPSINFKQIARKRTDAIQTKLARARNLCENCQSKQYTLSNHLLSMSNDGFFYGPTPHKMADAHRMSAVKRVLSDRYFTSNYVCNQMVDIIRKFAAQLNFYKAKINKEAADWHEEDVRKRSVAKILNICQEAKGLVEKGGRVVRVTSPCYVIGDIHGNLSDLLTYERVIWRQGPYLGTANYLFLGDYVDRGDWSVECIIYLLCMKLLAPDRIFMLRGNHECRPLQTEFTFLSEVNTKFGSAAKQVFDAFNEVFDVMPLCGLIDESIYCAHGGIPSCAQKIEQIMSIPCPLPDPDEQSPIAMEILWNDPVTDTEYEDLVRNNQEAKDSANKVQKSFLPNTKRGTGCFYSEDALKSFMEGNSLSHVIRAHEVIPAGYNFHLAGRCVTVFSCSHYCDGINEAAVALVHDSKIRVIKVDTLHPT